MAGNIPIESEDEVAKLTAQVMGVDLGDDMPDTAAVRGSPRMRLGAGAQFDVRSSAVRVRCR